jgi:putative transposase
LPEAPNQRWSLDFVSDTLTDGRRLRVLCVVDDFTRECLALVADTSLSGRRVVRVLDAIASRRGYPATVVSDNGTELTSSAVLAWSQDRNVGWHYIAPGGAAQGSGGVAAGIAAEGSRSRTGLWRASTANCVTSA